MSANTPEAEPIYVAPYIGPVHTERSGKVELWPQQYKDALLSMHRKGWQARANLPPPQGDADKVDAERFRFIESLGTVETRWRDAQEINFEWPRDTELSAAIDAAIAAGLTPRGQKP